MSEPIRKFCIDDWGMSPSINDAAIELIERKLIYSVSVLVSGKYMDYRLDELLSAQSSNQVKISLHFNLTYGFKYCSPVQLTYAYFFKKLEKNFIENQLLTQLEIAKQKKIKFDMIDGHHHIHILPFVFNVIDTKFAALTNKTIRIMNDKQHLSSWLSSFLFLVVFRAKLKKWSVLSCGYLLSKNLKNKIHFELKVNEYSTLIIHSAKYNDFDKIEFYDTLTVDRVREFEKILEFCN